MIWWVLSARGDKPESIQSGSGLGGVFTGKISALRLLPSTKVSEYLLHGPKTLAVKPAYRDVLIE